MFELVHERLRVSSLLQVGFSVLQRSGGAPVSLDPPLSITHQSLRPLESLMKCVEMGWMSILVGPTASGKTSLVRLLALLTGHRLRVMAMNSAMDTTELLGGFEQVTARIPSPSEHTRTRQSAHFFLPCSWTSCDHGSRCWRAWTTSSPW